MENEDAAIIDQLLKKYNQWIAGGALNPAPPVPDEYIEAAENAAQEAGYNMIEVQFYKLCFAAFVAGYNATNTKEIL